MKRDITNSQSGDDKHFTRTEIDLIYECIYTQKARQIKVGFKPIIMLFLTLLLFDLTAAAFVERNFAESRKSIGVTPPVMTTYKLLYNLSTHYPLPHGTSTFLSLASDDNEDDILNEEELPPLPITQEEFYREMLSHPMDDEGTESETEAVVFRRKSKKKGHKQSLYKPTDNRDSLPFIVKDCTPDPYTKPGIIEREAKKNSQVHKKKIKNESKVESNKKSKKKPVRMNLYGSGIESGIAASVYKRKDDGSLDKILGQFQLDKSTNCGDLLEIGVGENNKEYEVLRAKCQYKYAGGKKFVMVRKILEVKEITRLAEENYLKRQLKNTPDLPK